MGRTAGRSVLSLALAALLYFVVYRPAQLRWGASDQEVLRAMPGDEVQPRPIFNATRAITVQAPPEQIWRWLVQMGFRRAGWYGYDWIDNDGIPSSDRVLQEWQVGDSLPIWRKLDFQVKTLEARRYFVISSQDNRDSMALELFPIDAKQTRLVWRIRLGAYNWKSWQVALQFFTDLADFIAVRQNMLGIKARAEGRALESEVRMHGELGLWVVAFLLLVAAEIALVVRKELWQPLIVAAGPGLFTVWVVLAKAPVWIEVPGVIASAALLWRVYANGPSTQWTEPKRVEQVQ
jgi:hypothetical protein